MDIHEISLLEELMDGVGRQRADPERRLEQVRARAQMRDGPEIFHRVALLLHRIIRRGGAFELNLLRLDLKRLLRLRRRNQLSGHDHGRADIQPADLAKFSSWSAE